MKKHVLLMVSVIFLITGLNAQTTTIYDGETVIPDFWDIGGNPPNGPSCPSGAGWTLNVSGKMDIMKEGLSNPHPGGLNTTEKVIRFVRAKEGEGWAGAAMDVTGLHLNISQANHFSVLVYKEIAGNVTMKLEGAGSQEVNAYYDTPGQWKKMDFWFDAGNFSGSPTSLLVFPHNQTGLSETIITYWDEVTMYDGSNNPTVINDGNNPVSGFFLDGYWGPNGALNNLETDIFPNLSKSGVNTSNHVMRFLRAKDGLNWCGLGDGGLNINVASTPVVSLMIYKAVAGRVGVKLEGAAGTQEIYADYTTPGQWARLNFTFNPALFSSNPYNLIIYPHFEETNLVNLADHTPMYIDNVILRSSATESSDYFRSKTSGNWGDAGTWESSFDNSNWNAATAVPTSAAASVTVQNGHLVTVADNAAASVLTVNAGAKLTLNSGKSLAVSTFNILSDALGVGTFVDNGSFTATTDNVQQYMTSGRNWYISSPVSGAKSSVFNAANSANKLYGYDEAHNSWPAIVDNTTDLTVMKGYVANVSSTGVVTFSGTLNSGSQSITVNRTSGQAKEGFNLVGNPYTSYLDWDQATKTNLLSTMWYRTKNLSSNYVFDTYNANGQLGTNNNGSGAVNNHIPPMQAFWVRVAQGSATGTMAVNNTMLTHKDGSDGMFKTSVSKMLTQTNLHLQLSDGTNTDETIIYSNVNATNSLDDYDSPKMVNSLDKVAQIYTISDSEELAINGLNSIKYDTEILLGFRTATAGNFSIKASQISNFEIGTQIILKDYLNAESPVLTDLSDGSSYSFTSDASSNNTSRFAFIVKAPSVTTGINSDKKDNIWISTTVKNQLMINGIPATGATVEIYSALGQKLLSKTISRDTKQLNCNLPAGTYLVKLNSIEKISLRKIIID